MIFEKRSFSSIINPAQTGLYSRRAISIVGAFYSEGNFTLCYVKLTYSNLLKVWCLKSFEMSFKTVGAYPVVD